MQMSSYKGWNVYDYYQWLLEKVEDPIAENHTLLLRDLHNIPFRWSIHMDMYRAKSGINLRADYLEEAGLIGTSDYIFTEYETTECSVLEMIVALAECFSRDVIGTSYKSTAQWFWIMIGNLDLLVAVDEHYSPDYVRDRVKVFIDRAYQRNGVGGMFPLKRPSKDQRGVDIWHQISEWFRENYLDIENDRLIY